MTHYGRSSRPLPTPSFPPPLQRTKKDPEGGHLYLLPLLLGVVVQPAGIQTRGTTCQEE